MKNIFLLFLLSALIFLGSCKKDDEVDQPATISDITIEPSTPVPSSPVTISARVSDSKGVSYVKLYYTIGSANYTVVNMVAAGDIYTGVIPAQPALSVVNYYIEVFNSSSVFAYAPSTAPTIPSSYTVASAPNISNLTIFPVSPLEIQTVTVSATITDLNAISSVKLYYKVGNGSFTSLTMNLSGGKYSAIIPAQNAGVQVSYYVEATNSEGMTSYSPSTAPASLAFYAVNSIFINEIWSWGSDTTEFDWIEIYNSSGSEVNIGGYKLYDSGGQSGSKDKLVIPNGTIIPTHGFYTVVVDDPAQPGNFGLGKTGEEIWLENSNGVIIDNFVYLSTDSDTKSYGRKPDGSGNFFIFSQITKNASNNNAATAK